MINNFAYLNGFVYQWVWLSAVYVKREDSWRKNLFRVIFSACILAGIAAASVRMRLDTAYVNRIVNALPGVNTNIDSYLVSESFLRLIILLVNALLLFLFFAVTEHAHPLHNIAAVCFCLAAGKCAVLCANVVGGFFFNLPAFMYGLMIPVICLLIGAVFFRKLNRYLYLLNEHDSLIVVCILLLSVISTDTIISVYQKNGDFLLAVSAFGLPFFFTVLLYKGILVSRYALASQQYDYTVRLLKNGVNTIQEYSVQMNETKNKALHHISHIHQFLEEHDTKGAWIYAEKVMLEYSDKKQSYSSNVYVDAILNYYSQKYPELDIDAKITIGDDCPVQPMDIGMIVFLITDRMAEEKNSLFRFQVTQLEDDVYMHFYHVGNILSETDDLFLYDLTQKYSGSVIYKNDDLLIVLPGSVAGNAAEED